MIGSCAVVASAVEDALRPLGAEIREIPLTPYRLWHLIHQGKISVRYL